jgi:hypothetical protein
MRHLNEAALIAWLQETYACPLPLGEEHGLDPLSRTGRVFYVRNPVNAHSQVDLATRLVRLLSLGESGIIWRFGRQNWMGDVIAIGLARSLCASRRLPDGIEENEGYYCASTELDAAMQFAFLSLLGAWNAMLYVESGEAIIRFHEAEYTYVATAGCQVANRFIRDLEHYDTKISR